MLSKEQKTSAKSKIRGYLADNFDVEIGNLQAEMLLDYFVEHVGIYCYNQAVADSMGFLTERVDDMYLLMKEEN
jgi:uncharacterized protein (DUF2164 family)